VKKRICPKWLTCRIEYDVIPEYPKPPNAPHRWWCSHAKIHTVEECTDKRARSSREFNGCKCVFSGPECSDVEVEG
jgi:hypothetical protein